jgi:hypothetical protein
MLHTYLVPIGTYLMRLYILVSLWIDRCRYLDNAYNLLGVEGLLYNLCD